MTSISSKHYSPGDVIQVCEPFVHSLSYECKSKYCDYCMAKNPSLKKCTVCENMFYCDRKCQLNDWKCHKLECRLIADNSQKIKTLMKDSKSNQYLVLFRLSLLLNKYPSLATKKYPLFNGTERCFDDLIRHEQILKYFFDYDQNTAKYLSLLNSLGIKITPKELKRISGKIMINSFGLFEPDINQIEIGCGVYIPISVFNHSCEPNANFLSYGNKIKIRAMKSIEPKEEIFLSYIAVDRRKKDRQQLLYSSKCFKCQCVRCDSDWDSSFDYDNMESLCKEQNRLSIELQECGTKRYSRKYETTLNRILELGEQIIAVKKPLYRYYSHNIGCDMFVHSLNLLDAMNSRICNLKRDKVESFVRLTAEYIKITHGSEHDLYKSFTDIAKSHLIRV